MDSMCCVWCRMKLMVVQKVLKGIWEDRKIGIWEYGNMGRPFVQVFSLGFCRKR